MKRQRGRNRNNNNNNNRNNNNPNKSMDSNGPDVKVRGNASTIYEKYVQLARDATSNGSRVKAENYLQHAEHYLRLVNLQEAEKKAREEEREAQQAARRAKHVEQDDTDDTQNRRPRRNERRPKNQNESSEPEAQESGDEPAAELEAPKPKPHVRRSQKSNETPAGLEVVKPDTDEGIEPAPKRRRTAPKRKDKSEEAVDAAE